MRLRVATLNLEQHHKRWALRRELVIEQLGRPRPDVRAGAPETDQRKMCVSRTRFIVQPLGPCHHRPPALTAKQTFHVIGGAAHYLKGVHRLAVQRRVHALQYEFS